MEAENTSLMYQAPVAAADRNFPLTFEMPMANAELMLESRGMSSQERKRSEDNFCSIPNLLMRGQIMFCCIMT